MFLDENGITVHVPPRILPFPVSYINPVKTETVGGVVVRTYQIPSNYKKGRFKVVADNNYINLSAISFLVDGKIVIPEAYVPTARYFKNNSTNPKLIGHNNYTLSTSIGRWIFSPVDVMIYQADYLSNDISQGYITLADTSGPFTSYEVDFDGTKEIKVQIIQNADYVSSTAEVICFEEYELEGTYAVDSWVERRISWHGEDEVFKSPRLASAGEWLLVFDETRSFVYNVVTNLFIDIPYSTGLWSGTKDRFYFVEGSKLYEILPPFDAPLYKTDLGFIPDAAVSQTQAIFLRFVRNTQISTSTFTFSVQPDGSYTYTSGSTVITGTISNNCIAIGCAAQNDIVYVVVRKSGGYSIVEWTPNEKTEYPVEFADFSTLNLLSNNLYAVQRVNVPIVRLNGQAATLSYCGKWWSAIWNGSNIQIVFLEPKVYTSELRKVSAWQTISAPVQVEAGKEIEVETPSGDITVVSSPAVLSPSKYVFKIKSFFDIFPTFQAISTVFGNVTKIVIVQGPFPMRWDAEVEALLESKYGVDFIAVDAANLDSYNNQIKNGSYLFILTPGTVIAYNFGEAPIYPRVAALIPGTAVAYISHSGSSYLGYFYYHGVIGWGYDQDGQYHYNTIWLVPNSNAYTRYSIGHDGNSTFYTPTTTFTMDMSTFQKILCLTDPTQYKTGLQHVFEGSYAWGEIVEGTSEMFGVPFVVGTRYRIVYEKELLTADYELYNYDSSDYTGPAYLETDISDAAEVVFDTGHVGKVVTAPSGKKYIFIPQVNIPAGSTLKLNITSKNSSTAITGEELEDRFYPFDNNSYDFKNETFWQTQNSIYDGFGAILQVAQKDVALTGSMAIELTATGNDALLYIDDYPVVWVKVSDFVLK